MIEIGALCKIYPSDTIYKINDIREKNIMIRLDNKTKQLIEYFVDLEENENPNNKVPNISVTKISIVK